MKYLWCLFIFTSILLPSYTITRGTTQHEMPDGTSCIGQAQQYNPINTGVPSSPVSPFTKEEWIAIDSLHLNTIINAGNQYGVLYNSTNQTMEKCSSMGQIIPSAQTAIQKSPSWIQPMLTNVFSQLNAEKQQSWAEIIVNAIDPYIDEIAFSVANSSVQFLASNYADPSLFVENAQQLYSIDSELSYVQIINHGTSVSDPGYYSTTSYYKTTSAGQVIQMEVPKEIYYWYIVHPKITDEIPAYIDPSIIESNTTHSNNIMIPPDGKFWRSYFYNIQEGTYPALRDTLIECQTLFNRNGVSGDAIRAIQWWINQTMSFTSNSERPHQPVRIYKKHIGRCGEYSDYTTAAARTALIPCTGILAASSDHTWNEFWEDGWVHWEPVNHDINNPLVYENGWGKVFGSVFEIRSDGFLTPVTDRYSEGIATITIAVKDSSDHPIDGARVILAIDSSGIKFDTVGFTDNDGLVVFTVGDSCHYYARAESTVGNYPANAGAYVTLVDNTIAGQQYAYQLILPNPKPLPQINQISIPPDNEDDWRFAISFNAPMQLLYGKVSWDDLQENGLYPYFYKEVNTAGKVNFMITDADNYMFYNIAHSADAFNVLENVSNGSSMFNIPDNNIWYSFIDNSSQVANPQLVTGVMLYQNYGVANDDQTIPETSISLASAFPNPFSRETTIKYTLPQSTMATITVYNSKGQKVKTLVQAQQTKGAYTEFWNGNDDYEKQVSNGIYFIRLTAAGKTLNKKILLLK